MVKLGAEIHGRTNTHKGGGLRNNGYEFSNAQQSTLTLIIRARRDWSSQSSKIVKANDMCPTATFFTSIACVACGIVMSRVRSWRKARHTGRAVRYEGNNLTCSQSSRGYDTTRLLISPPTRAIISRKEYPALLANSAFTRPLSCSR